MQDRGDQFEAEVNRVYKLFQQVIADNRAQLPETFVELVQEDPLVCKSTDNQTLARLAVMSSHAEWEGLYQTPINHNGDVLGSCCAELTSQGLTHFDMTIKEMSLLRAEILSGDTTYNDCLTDIEVFTKEYNKNKDLRSLITVIDRHIYLHHTDVAWDYIRELRNHVDAEPAAEVLIAVFTSHLYKEVINAEYREDDVVYALKLFEKNEITNRLFSFFDHCAYVIHWTDLIRVHLTALEDRCLAAQDIVDLKTAVESVLTRTFSSAYSGLQMFSPEFVMTAGEDTLELMKRHDELLLSIVDYVADPLNLLPIFNGTYLLIWRKSLHVTFPGKLDWYLYGVPRDAWRYRSHYDYTDSSLMEHLIAEFPSHEDEIRARFTDDPSSADDDSAETYEDED